MRNSGLMMLLTCAAALLATGCCAKTVEPPSPAGESVTGDTTLATPSNPELPELADLETSTQLAQGPAWAEALCKAREERVISMSMVDSGKQASVCVTSGPEGYMVYRFGTREAVELEFPQERENSFSRFMYSSYFRGGGPGNEGLDLQALTFVNGDARYEVYQEYTAVENTTHVGIRVTVGDSGETIDLAGKDLQGGLQVLKEEERVQQGNL